LRSPGTVAPACMMGTARERVMSEERMAPEEMAVVALALGGFRREASLWPRRGLNMARVREFAELYRAEGAEALPPVLVVEVAGTRYLADGWHRCAAATAAGLTQMYAELTRAERLEDVYVAAVATSSRNGEPLTRTEKREAVDRLLVEAPEGLSDRGIARLAGVSQPFVGRRRARLAGTEARERGARREVMPAERVAARVVRATVELERLFSDMRQYEEGQPLDPARALARAAERGRGDADAVLARLEGWAARARGLVEGDGG
jgi:hypothetical protein